MKKVNIYLIITAVLLIALGVVCIFNPGAGFASAAWLMGLFILASGISSLIFGLRAQAFLPNAGSTTLLAVFQIVVGIMLATNILASEIALIAVFSMWVMFEGVSLAVLSIDYKKGGYDRWWLMLLLGVCSILLGFLALRKPEATGALLGIFLGLDIVEFSGLSDEFGVVRESGQFDIGLSKSLLSLRELIGEDGHHAEHIDLGIAESGNSLQ